MSVNTPLRELILINVGRVNGIMQTIAEDVGDLAAENTRLRAENAELRAELDETQRPGIRSYHLTIGAFSAPRVIIADELREGQMVTGRFPDGRWCRPRSVHVSELDPRRPLVIGDDGYYPTQFSPIVLLEDAPVKDVDTSAPSLKENGENFTGSYHHAILPNGRVVSYEEAKHIKDEDLEAKPRLTVHALNIAPVGSVVTGWGVDYTKHYDGQWCDNTGCLWSDGEVAGRTMGATLHYPERGDDEQL